ncbi:hypothetical protein BGZ60DRAFT_435262 [Tricladium varicosporioides]|nr:hypothetical protein BGZ60DRAFT_435262 [Hymenoscyphus varicosporioides]
MRSPGNQLKDNIIHLEDVEISFQRTVKVPDDHNSSKLPPSFGKFPLYPIKDHAAKLPPGMVAKGGLFFPMYQKEAMWIRFKSERPYAVKIYTGAVNAISGEPIIETAATRLRRQASKVQNKSIQDYLILPDQKWLDGICTSPGKVRQFVAMPIGSGYSVEAQVTGEDTTGGLQFEITPEAETIDIQVIAVVNATYLEFRFTLPSSTTVDAVKLRIQKDSKFQPEDIRKYNLVFDGEPLEDNCLLSDYSIEDGAEILLHPINRTSGPKSIWGGGQKKEEMTIAPGGFISQAVVQDKGGRTWDPARTKVFNVQILNTIYFQQVTGLIAPKSPIDAETCAKLGIQFYNIEEKPSDVVGDFNGVKSIAQMDGKLEEPSVLPSKEVPPLRKRDRFAAFLGKPKLAKSSEPPRIIHSSWSCPMCKTSNSASNKFCPSCGSAKAFSSSSDPSPSTSELYPSTPLTPVKDAPLVSDTVIDIGFFNRDGPKTDFKSLVDLEKEYQTREIVDF